jgi:hypothetical protein
MVSSALPQNPSLHRNAIFQSGKAKELLTPTIKKKERTCTQERITQLTLTL